MIVRTWLRTWGRSLLLTGQFVVTITVGVAAGTALVSVLLAVGYQPLPYRDPDRLVAVWRHPELGRNVMAISGPDLVDFRDSTPGVFSSLGGLVIPQMWLFDGRGAMKVRACYIEAGVFGDLGLRPVLGREVRQDDEPLTTTSAAAAPAWISHEFWQTRYGGSASVIGATIAIAQGASGRDSRPVQIVGVLPRGASIPLPFLNNATDIWYLLPRDFLGSRSRQAAVFFGLGRLRPGVTAAQAEAALDAVAARLGQRSSFDKGKHAVVRSLVTIAQGPARQSLGLLILAGGLVFLVACVNLAMLMGAEGRLRRREIGIRTALGASRSRLWREVATEKCVLTLLSLGLGLVAAPALLRVLAWLVPAAGLGPPLDQPPPLNLSIPVGFAIFTLGAALLWSALLVSAAERRGASLRLAAAGGPGFTGPSDSGHGAGRWRLILLAAQAAIGICLLSAVALTVRAYTSRASGDLGPAPRRTVLLAVSPRDNVMLTAPQAADFNRGVRSQLERLPGTEAVALADVLPPVGFPIPFAKDGDGGEVERETTVPTSVSPGYFRTFGIPILFGRGFDETEEKGAEPVAIISLDMAQRHWTPAREAVGSRITLGQNGYSIVGVAADFRGYWYEKPVPTVYVSESQSGNWSGCAIVRTTASASTVAALAPQALAKMPIAVTVSNVGTMWGHWRSMTTRPLARMVGMLMLALLGLALCVQGVYAVATGTAASRGHELAVRSALGASPARLAWHVTRELTMALLIGAASGHAAAVTARSVVEQWLGTPVVRQGESTAIATVVLGLTAAVGCFLPTRAAVRTNPTDLLRQG